MSTWSSSGSTELEAIDNLLQVMELDTNVDQPIYYLKYDNNTIKNKIPCVTYRYRHHGPYRNRINIIEYNGIFYAYV
jgi:hypothetical protein